MILKYYSIKDVKIDYGKLIPALNIQVLGRDIREALASKTPNELNKHPQDLELWYVGEFDTETGIFTPGLEFVSKIIAYDEGEKIAVPEGDKL